MKLSNVTIDTIEGTNKVHVELDAKLDGDETVQQVLQKIGQDLQTKHHCCTMGLQKNSNILIDK